MTFYEMVVLAEIVVCIWATVVCLKKVVGAPAMVLSAIGMALLAIAPIAVFVWEVCGRWWSWAQPEFFEERSLFVSRSWAVLHIVALMLVTLGIKFSHRPKK